jgi:hypothetical protein
MKETTHQTIKHKSEKFLLITPEASKQGLKNGKIPGSSILKCSEKLN